VEITNKMLVCAIQKAVEVKLVPKWGDPEAYVKIWDGMKEVLDAAINS